MAAILSEAEREYAVRLARELPAVIARNDSTNVLASPARRSIGFVNAIDFSNPPPLPTTRCRHAMDDDGKSETCRSTRIAAVRG